ncbi:MAG: hypothetical protein Q8868_12580 [Bacteroidota bacterium]|nr:hypothetical protein [Bacteroidota bacterium]
MRRHLKIKIWPLLIAWMMIFLHGIIPHNHADEYLGLCNGRFHYCDTGFHQAPDVNNTIGEQSDTSICHISNLLFNSLNDDHLILHLCKVVIVSPEVTGSPVKSITDQSYVSDLYHGTTSFRAPPLA